MQFWYLTCAWLWRLGACGDNSSVMPVWHSKQSCLTDGRFSILGLLDPCGMWQVVQPSSFAGACSNTNGPCLFEWHLIHAMSAPTASFGLFRFKAAVGVVTVGALHRALKHLVVEWLCELRFLLAVAAKAKLGLAQFEHGCRRLFFDQCH